MSSFLCLLGRALLVISVATSDNIPQADLDALNTAPTVHLMTFQPGKLGMSAQWNMGTVTQVDKGGQAEKLGVKVADRIDKVDGKTYTERLIDKRVAGTEPFELTIVRRPPETKKASTAADSKPTPKYAADDPPKPDFKYATELNETSFKELVYMVTNGTTSNTPPYYPVVMFHMSWCKHCRHTLPEIEKAAEMLDETKRKQQGNSKLIHPRFFVIQCDGADGHKELCDMYGHSTYPVIKAFRDGRSYHYNRPRVAQTFAWWATQVTRPPVIGLQSEKEVDAFKSRGNYFALSAYQTDTEIMKAWADVALDNIEEHNCVFVFPGSAAANKFAPAPSLSVNGEGMEGLPFEGKMNRQSMTEWVNFNQFKPVQELQIYNIGQLRSCGFPVVAFMYDPKQWFQVKMLEQFQAKAKELRKKRKYIFATVDLSNTDTRDQMEYSYPLFFQYTAVPLLSPKEAVTPRIFAFDGDDQYWENSTLTPSMLSMDSIAALLADDWAHQDDSFPSKAKEKAKMVARFAQAGPMGMFITFAAVTILLAILKFVMTFLKAICSADDESEDAVAKKAD